ECQGGPLAGEPLEVTEREVADHQVDRAKREADGYRHARLAADRGLSDPANPPGRGEHPRDRARPAGQEREPEEEAGNEPDRVLEEVRQRVRVPQEDEG